MAHSEPGSDCDGSESVGSSFQSSSSRFERIHVGAPWKRLVLELRLLFMPLHQRQCVVTQPSILSVLLFVVTAIQYLQLFSLASSAARYPAASQDVEISGFMRFLEHISFFGRAEVTYDSLVVRTYIFGALLLFSLTVLGFAWKLRETSSNVPSWFLSVWAVLTVTMPIFVAPSALSFFSMVNCERHGDPMNASLLSFSGNRVEGVYCISVHAVHIIFSALFFVLLVALSVLQILCYHPGFTRLSTIFDVSFPWAADLPVMAAKIMLAAALFFISTVWIVGLIALACGVMLSCCVTLFLPYKRHFMNIGFTALWLSLFAPAAFSLSGMHVVLLQLLPVTIAVFALIGAGVARVRAQQLRSRYLQYFVRIGASDKRSRSFTERGESMPSDVAAVEYPKTIPGASELQSPRSTAMDLESGSNSDIEDAPGLSTVAALAPYQVVTLTHWFLQSLQRRDDAERNRRYGFSSPSRISPIAASGLDFTSDDPVLLVQNIFEEHLQVYPSSFLLKMQYVEFLLAVSRSAGRMYGQSRIHELLRDFETMTDVCPLYLQGMWLSLMEVRRSLDSTASVEIHMGLRRAARASASVVRVSLHFWESLLQEDASSAVLRMLPVFVSDMEREELRALMVFRKLLSNHGTNPSVLRAYAAFLEHVQGNVDSSMAQQYFELADMYESRIQHQETSKTPKTTCEHRPTGRSEWGRLSTASDMPSTMSSSTRCSKRRLPIMGPSSPSVEFAPSEASFERQSMSASVPSGSSSRMISKPLVRHSDAASVLSDSNRSAGTSGKRADYHAELQEDMRSFVNGKSLAVQRVKIAVYLSLTLILAVTVAIFIVGQRHLDVILNGSDLVGAAGGTRKLTQEVALYTRSMETTAMGLTPGSLPGVASKLRKSAADIETAASSLFLDSRSNDYLLRQWKKQDGAEIVMYSRSTGQTSRVSMSGWDMYQWYVRQARTVANMSAAMFLPSSPNVAEFRQIILNGPYNLLDGVWALVHSYETMYSDVVQRERIIQWVLCAVILLIPLLLVAGLYIPALRSIERERDEILRLFLLVPKAHVGRMCVQTKAQLISIAGGMLGDRSTATDVDDGNSGDSVDSPVGKRLPNKANGPQQDAPRSIASSDRSHSSLFYLNIRFFVVLLVSTCLALTLGALVLRANYEYANQAAQINYAGSRRSYSYRMVHLCSELVRNDGNFRTRERIRQDLVDAVAQLREIHEAVKYGSEKYGTPGSVGTSQRQDDLLFVPRCAATDDMKCMSLDTLMSLFLDKVRDFTSVADSSLSYGSVEYASIVDVESKHMGNLLSVSKDFYVSDSLPVIEATRSNMAYVFGFSFPALIGLYLFLVHSMLSRVEKEVRRSRRMLSMVPVDVIASISAIEQFVRSHGKQDGTREALANAVKDSQLKTRSVLAASVDAVIEFNCEGRIVSLNPSAEKMFICKAASAVGEDIAMFFPSSELVPVSGHAMAITGDSTEEVNPEQALRGHMSLLLHRCRNSEDGSCEGVVWETMVARSDSETFPAQVSLCVGRTQGEVYFAAFIRDLSVLKKQESLLRLEREKSEKLLSTILPKSIAARLKASEGHVVDVYDSVSVVFTDIVKFTETASRMTPQAVVGMLSDLFSEMDSLASKHGVEKIKTLGDGWLGCAGLFGRYHDHSLACVEWGRDVLAFLRMYNAEHGTNIMFRIGIATGPVTAGVIGTSRLQFDIFGDTVNLASRMESTSLPGRINLSREVYERIYDKVLCEERTVEVKGKGLMQTFLVTQ